MTLILLKQSCAGRSTAGPRPRSLPPSGILLESSSRDILPLLVLVIGPMYPQMERDHLYGRIDTHGCFAIYLFDPSSLYNFHY